MQQIILGKTLGTQEKLRAEIFFINSDFVCLCVISAFVSDGFFIFIFLLHIHTEQQKLTARCRVRKLIFQLTQLSGFLFHPEWHITLAYSNMLSPLIHQVTITTAMGEERVATRIAGGPRARIQLLRPSTTLRPGNRMPTQFFLVAL